jgi:predicted secreted hydrolase
VKNFSSITWLVLVLLLEPTSARGEELIQAFAFPADEGMHAQSSTEMWAAHGFVEGKNGERYAIAAMLFDGRWQMISGQLASIVVVIAGKPDVYSGEHIFLPLVGDVQHTTGMLAERFGRSYFRRSSANVVDVAVWTDGPSMGLRARGGTTPALLCGTGESRFGDRRLQGYGITRSSAVGRLELNGKSTPIRGRVRLDHLWGDRISAGYDLIAASFDDGRELTILSVHGAAGSEKLDGSCAALTGADGENRVLRDLNVRAVRTWLSTQTGARYPVELDVQSTLPASRLVLRASNDDQEVRIGGIAAYHGTCTLAGSFEGHAISGRGFFILLPANE